MTLLVIIYQDFLWTFTESSPVDNFKNMAVDQMRKSVHTFPCVWQNCMYNNNFSRKLQIRENLKSCFVISKLNLKS